MPRRKRCTLCECVLGIISYKVKNLPGTYCLKCAQKLCAKNEVPIPLDERKH